MGRGRLVAEEEGPMSFLRCGLGFDRCWELGVSGDQIFPKGCQRGGNRESVLDRMVVTVTG